MTNFVSLDGMLESLKKAIKEFPDKRTGNNTVYTMEEVILGAFSVFFTQSPSFLAHQKLLEKAKGKSNAQTIFGIEKIPTANHIKDLADTISPKLLCRVFEDALNSLRKEGYLNTYREINNNILIALDGTWYFSSKKIHCDNCSTMHHRDGTITYYHSAITPVIVASDQKRVISLAPEFIVPQDGYDKQDCENAAAKRWIEKNGKDGKKYNEMGVTVLGDDLYCNQPMCENMLNAGFNFILVCKGESHKTLYEWVELLEEGVDRHKLEIVRWTGRRREIYVYRYAQNVPIRDSEDALRINWYELTVSTEEGKIIYKNSFVTNHEITSKNIEKIVSCGRARWKIENENNNTLKTKGYNLEHNFGHGKQNLSSLLMTLNVLAFLFHTILEIVDAKYGLIRKELPSRETFFDDIRALTRYICFESWDNLLDFMLEGLELSYDSG